MRSSLALSLVVLAGCATAAPAPLAHPATELPRVAQAPTPADVAPEASRAESTIVAPNPALPVRPTAVASSKPAPAVVAVPDATAEDQAADADDDEAAGADEGESHEATGPSGGPRYTLDLSDGDLEKLWRATPSKLGSMSVGFVDAGRLVNGERFPNCTDGAWTVVTPEKSYGTHETVQYLITAIRAVKAQYPEAPPLRVNQISGPEGGWLRPHKSHQNGRDADIAFYYPTADVVRAREREKYIDVPKSWAFIKAVVTLTDVQMILVDRRVQKVLYDYALRAGEDQAWLDSLFHNGDKSIIKHARRHRDHFHVRFFNPRAQELGRRVAPLLAEQPEFNVAMHKVKHGDTLGHIALKYGSDVKAIKKANHMSNNFLRLGQVLQVPLHGACTHCPIPPEIVLPPRRLPPSMLAQQAPAAAPQVAADAHLEQPAHVEPASSSAAAVSPVVQPAVAPVAPSVQGRTPAHDRETAAPAGTRAALK